MKQGTGTVFYAVPVLFVRICCGVMRRRLPDTRQTLKELCSIL